MTGVIVLAAGASTRMGVPKQLLPWRGATLLQHAVQTALDTALGPVIVVLGAQAERCREALDRLAVATVVNAGWAAGQGGSIAAGVAELERLAPELEGVLILLHDQPAISAVRLVEFASARREGDLVVAACYNGITGAPAWFRRDLFPELRELNGSSGARKIIEAHAAHLRRVDLPEAALDIDTPTDYVRAGGTEVTAPKS